MGAIIYDDDVIPLEHDGETYQLKRKMSHGDIIQVENNFIRMAQQMERGDVKAEAGEPLLLLINIKSWSLRDRDGNPLPVTAENINRLDPDHSRAILAEINDRNPAPKAPVSAMTSMPRSQRRSKKEST